jgi:cephalosporin hydroxylase
METMTAAALHYGTPTIIELGVRTGVSSALWLAAIERSGGGLLWSVDVEEPHGGYVSAIIGHPNWELHVSDDLAIADQAPEADILFIDTSHSYAHTLAELVAYVPKLQPEGIVLLHDSNVEHASAEDEGNPWPVMRAIDTYISEFPEWSVDHTTDRYGLALMVRGT